MQQESVKKRRYHFRPLNGGGRIGPPIMIIDHYRYGCDLVEFVSAESTRGELPRQKRIENGLKTKKTKEKKLMEAFLYEVSSRPAAPVKSMRWIRRPLGGSANYLNPSHVRQRHNGEVNTTKGRTQSQKVRGVYAIKSSSKFKLPALSLQSESG